MNRDDIVRLAGLARIELTDAEIDAFQGDIGDILSYVGEIQAITGNGERQKVVGPVFNVMRKDEPLHKADEYTEALVREMPEHEGRYLKVKKILGDS